MIDKVKNWFMKQWKAVGAFLGLAIASFLMYTRSKNQKKILNNAIKLHKDEIDVYKDSEKKIVDGLEEIQKKQTEDTKKLNQQHEVKEKDLQAQKSDFIKDANNDEDLAKKLANKLGADFVE